MTGIVSIEPQHDPRTVTIQVVGTDKYFNNTDAAGRFVMKDMAKGNYTLLLKSTLPDYTPTTSEITVKACSNDTLKDTLRLIYTGIPVVTGISIKYDTLNGIVHLTWKKSIFRDVQSYTVYRDFYDSINVSTNPIAAVNDTSFSDTIFKRDISSDEHSFSDTNDYRFKYRVAIRSNVNTEGQAYRYADIVAVSPLKVNSYFSFGKYHVAKRFLTDSASTNDTIQFIVTVSNPNRYMNKILWADISNNAVVRSKTIETASKNIADTVYLSWDQLGQRGLECTAFDLSGYVWKDTTYLQVIKDIPSISFQDSIIYLNTPFTISPIIVDKYGFTSKIEWDIGNTGNFVRTTQPTFSITLDSIVQDYQCVLKITNNFGNYSIDTLHLRSYLTWDKIAEPFSANGSLMNDPVIFNNHVWVLEQVGNSMSNLKYKLWSSIDLQNWVCVVDSMLFQSSLPYYASLISFKDSLWVLGFYRGSSLSPSVTDSTNLFSSKDGTYWQFAYSDRQKLNYHVRLSSTPSNDTLWTLLFGPGNTIAYTLDMRNWHLIIDREGKTQGAPTFELFNNQLWTISCYRNDGNNGGQYMSLFLTNLKTFIDTPTNLYYSPSIHNYQESVVFNNKILITEVDSDSSTYSGMFVSSDGIKWSQCSIDLPFKYSGTVKFVVFNKSLFCISKQGIWRAK